FLSYSNCWQLLQKYWLKVEGLSFWCQQHCMHFNKIGGYSIIRFNDDIPMQDSFELVLCCTIQLGKQWQRKLIVLQKKENLDDSFFPMPFRFKYQTNTTDTVPKNSHTLHQVRGF